MISLGKNTIIRLGAILSPWGGSISFGENSGVNHYSVIYGHGGLVVGDLVRIAAHSVLIPANHGISLRNSPIYKQPMTKVGITIHNDVWIGAGCQILDGVTILEGSVIAAGAVVNSDVQAYAIYGGVPARLLRNRN